MSIDQVPADLTELYDRFSRPAFALARRILADDVLAEDVVQEVFVSIWRTPEAFDVARGSFSTWVLTMVHHKAVDAVRREQSQRTRFGRAQAEADVALHSVTPDLADDACRRVDAERVRGALSALPPVQRQALTLAYYNGFTQSEIATVTGAPLGTVKTRMRAGMGHLRRTLDSLADGAPERLLVDLA